jgi:large subunit ribosomal protein L20
MVRATNGAAAKRRKNRLFKEVKGYWGGRGRLYRTARETLMRAWAFSTVHRRQKKRTFRALWIARINAAARMRGTNYSQLVAGLKRSKIDLNRKLLAHLALHEPGAFDQLVESAKKSRAA